MENKVYLVYEELTWDEWDDTQIRGVFSTKDKAIEFVEKEIEWYKKEEKVFAYNERENKKVYYNEDVSIIIEEVNLDEEIK